MNRPPIEEIERIVRAHVDSMRAKKSDRPLTDHEWQTYYLAERDNTVFSTSSVLTLATRAYEAGAAASLREIEELRAERDKYGLMASQFASANEELGEVSMREKMLIEELQAEVERLRVQLKGKETSDAQQVPSIPLAQRPRE